MKKLNRKFGLSALLLIVNVGLNAQTYNVAYNDINFGGSGVTITNKGGKGTAVNNVVLYQNVITVGGQQIDAIVRTLEVNNVSTFSAFDQTGTGTGYTNNQQRWFSPQFSFGTGGGSAVFKFEFILGGSFNNSTNTGTIVTLQNVRVNTYDIDGNASSGNNGSNLGGFTSSELGNPTNLTMTYNSTLGLTKFRSTISTNTTDPTDVKNRVRVTYDYISEFTTKVGGDGSGLAYYFLDFASGATFTTAVTYAAPVLDLNTSTAGLDNTTSMVAPDSKNFTSGSANITYSGSTLDNLKVSITTTEILDGANEKLLISGATSGSTISLNFTNAQAITNVVLGGVTYAVTATVTGGRSILTFTKSGGGTLTVAQVESLLDALQYQNAATNATKAWRYFNVTTLAGSFETPVAQFQVNIDNVLPVELVSFAANCENENVMLNWQTASEHNSASFIIERSVDGVNWEFRSEIEAAGNSNSVLNYQYEDVNSERFVGYYRLTQVDLDGKEKIYDPIYSNCKTDAVEVEIYPNPAHDDLTISFTTKESAKVQIEYVNTNGFMVKTESHDAYAGVNQFKHNVEQLFSGIYYVKIVANDLITIKKLIVQ
ncbi:MAG: T9SS type A sorting domain-containing protein [Crocinitomicaceae bacterium]|nr:MAG: T9SS type A sorting domain-containing protein [Crocinitomicaceae bacterium]